MKGGFQMKDILKHYSKYILLDTLVVATLFAGAHAILSLFHLKFIEWVYYAVIGIIIIGILLGIFTFYRLFWKRRV